MNFRNTLILSGVALALLLFIAIFERGSVSTDEALLAEVIAFPRMREKDKADAIEIVKGDSKIVMVKRHAGTGRERWHITHPVDFRADTSRIIALMSSIERSVRFQVGEKKTAIPVEPTTNLMQYGLDMDSTTRVRVLARDEVLADFFLGLELGETERVYAMPSGRDRVFVTQKAVREESLRRLDEFRDPRLLDFRGGQAVGLTIFRQGAEVAEFARETGRDDWRMVSPVSDRAEQELVNLIANRMNSLHADKFVRDFAVDDPEMPRQLAEWKLQPGEYAVKVAVRSPEGEMENYEVRFGDLVRKTVGANVSHSAYTMVSGSRAIALVPSEAMAKLDLAADDFRKRGLFNPGLKQAERVEIAGGGRLLALERVGGGWRIVQPEERAADARAVQEYLDGLASVRVESFPAPEGMPTLSAEDEGFRVTVRGPGGAEEVVLVVPGESGEAFAVRDGSVGAKVPGSLIAALRKPVHGFYDRKVLDFDAGELRRLTLTVDGRTQRASREGGQWTSEDGEVDSILADNIRWTLGGLEVEKFVGPLDEGALGETGLAEPEITVDAVFAKDGTEKSFTLMVGGRAEDGYYARFAGESMVFVLREPVVSNLREGVLKTAGE